MLLLVDFLGSLPEDVFDEDEEKLDLRREQFLRNIIRQDLGGSSNGLLKMAEKDNPVVTQPTKVFEFAVISGIDGILLLACLFKPFIYRRTIWYLL